MGLRMMVLMDENEARQWDLAMEKIGRLDYALNTLRLALKIDPAISNDDPALVTALNAAVGLREKMDDSHQKAREALERKKAKTLAREERFLSLWRDGYMVKEIATTLDYSTVYIHSAICQLRKKFG